MIPSTAKRQEAIIFFLTNSQILAHPDITKLFKLEAHKEQPNVNKGIVFSEMSIKFRTRSGKSGSVTGIGNNYSDYCEF